MTGSRSDARRVIVIGGGMAGLSAACTAAARGHRVTLLEKNEWVGGKAGTLESGGFRFDMGPTILTAPSVLRRVFDEANRDLDDYLDLVRIEPHWRCFFDDGAILDLASDLDQMKMNLEEFTGSSDSSEGYARLLKMSARMHSVQARFLFWRSIGSVRDCVGARDDRGGTILGEFSDLQLGRSVSKIVRRHISDDRAAQMVDHFTRFVGSSPEASPAMLCGRVHGQASEGVWYPIGGIRSVALALSNLALELGVSIRMGVDVARILTDAGRVCGVQTVTGEEIRADAVISNCDSVRTYRELLADCKEARLNHHNVEPACSAVVLYLGLNRRYGQLGHHNFVFSRDPEEEHDYIYGRGQPAPEPTCYVSAPSISEPQVAPEGGEALYVLVHTPYMRPGHDWTAMLPEYRRRIIEKLQETAELDDLESHIEFERVLTPHDFHHRFRVLNGAIYGLSSHGKFTGALKPANRRSDIAGLYLAGGAAHPGPGLPMVVMSGWIAANAMDEDSA